MEFSILNTVDTGTAFCYLFDQTVAGIWDQGFYYGMTIGLLMGICMLNALKG